MCSIAMGKSNFNIFTTNLPPFSFEKENMVYGISADILIRLMEKAGNPIERSSIKIVPWARAYREIQKETNTIVFSMARTKEREALFKWVGPISSFSLGLIAPKKKKIVINSSNDLKKYRIGSQPDSAPEQLLIKEGIDTKSLERLTRADLNLKKLESGRIDMFAFSVPAAKHMMKQAGMNPNDYETVYVLKNVELYYAFHKNSENKLVMHLNTLLDSMKHPDSNGIIYVDVIEKSYIGSE